MSRVVEDFEKNKFHMNMGRNIIKKSLAKNVWKEEKENFSILRLIKPIQKDLVKTFQKRIFKILSKFHQFKLEQLNEKKSNRTNLKKRRNHANIQINQTPFELSAITEEKYSLNEIKIIEKE